MRSLDSKSCLQCDKYMLRVPLSLKEAAESLNVLACLQDFFMAVIYMHTLARYTLATRYTFRKDDIV